MPKIELVVEVYFFLQYTIFKMYSLICIVGVVLTDKENYPEWSQKIKHILIFNDVGKECVSETNIKTQNILPQTRNFPFGKIRTTRLMH